MPGDISRYTNQLTYRELQKHQIVLELSRNYHIYLDADDLQEFERAKRSNFLPPAVGGLVGLVLVAATWRRPSLNRLELHRQRMARFVLATMPALLASSTLPTRRYSQALQVLYIKYYKEVAEAILLGRK